MQEETHRVKTEERNKTEFLGHVSRGPNLSFLGPTQSKWIPPTFDATKLNLDAIWDKGKASIKVIMRNHEGNVMSLWYDNYCYVSPLVVELLAIQKAYIVLENFLN